MDFGLGSPRSLFKLRPATRDLPAAPAAGTASASHPGVRPLDDASTTLARPQSKIQNQKSKIAEARNPTPGFISAQARTGYLFVAPGLLLFLVFVLGPVLYAIYLSFTNYDIFTRQDWVGLDNYLEVMQSEIFWRAAFNTLYYSAVSIPAGMALSLGLALLLNQRIRGLVFFRTAYYLPVVTSMVAVAMIWVQLFDPSYGAVNHVLRLVGLPGPNWLGNPDLAMPAVIGMSIWKGLGWNMLVYLAGLQGIPEYLKEAAMIDGANRWQTFWKVIFPLLRPTTFFIFVTSCIGAFQVFDQVYVMTGGGPANATTTVVHQIYNAAFRSLDMGYASAMSFVLFGVILVVSIANLRYFRSEVEYY